MNLFFVSLFRIASVFVVCTFFVPDEFFQSVELSQEVVFGGGVVTWEWRRGLRSWLHPLLYVPSLSVLSWLRLDSTAAVVMAPRLTQAFLSIFGDYMLRRTAEKWFGPEVGELALVLHLLSWGVWFCWSRTLINSVEAVLTLAALSLWPVDASGERALSFAGSLAWMVLTVMFRPSSAVSWAAVGGVFCAQCLWDRRYALMARVGALAAALGIFGLAVQILIDTLMYGRLTFSSWNFVEFNVIKGDASFYGTHPWHWYFSNGLPTLFFSYAVFVAAGVWQSKVKKLAPFLVFVLFVPLVFSFNGHKEFRFVLPSLSVAIIYAAVGARWMWKREGRFWKAAVVLLVAVNVPMGLYFGTVHQRGTIAAMTHVRKTYKGQRVGVVMPCHSVPGSNFMHGSNITLLTLSCNPRGEKNDQEEEFEDSDIFFRDPGGHLGDLLKKWDPDVLVVFSPLLERASAALSEAGWQERQRFFHAHFYSDSRHGDVLVLGRK